MGEYAEGLKKAMIKKMTGAAARSATSLASEVGVPQGTLSRWLREYGRVSSTPMEGMMGKHPQNWGSKEKLRAVMAYEALEEEKKGKYLREQGLYEVDIERWRAEALAALEKKPSKRKDPQSARVKELERELRRKEKALAETAALLVLKKKVREIWGDREDGK